MTGGNRTQQPRSGLTPAGKMDRARMGGTSGAVSSTGILLLAQHFPVDSFIHLGLTLAAPWISLPISFLWYHVWGVVRASIADSLYAKRIERIRLRVQEILDDPHTAAEHKKWAVSELQKAQTMLLVIEIRRLEATMSTEVLPSR